MSSPSLSEDDDCFRDELDRLTELICASFLLTAPDATTFNVLPGVTMCCWTFKRLLCKICRFSAISIFVTTWMDQNKRTQIVEKRGLRTKVRTFRRSVVKFRFHTSRYQWISIDRVLLITAAAEPNGRFVPNIHTYSIFHTGGRWDKYYGSKYNFPL